MLKKVLDVISAANTLSLPVDVWKIARHFRYKVQFYSRSQDLLKSFNLILLASTYPAVSTKREGIYYIFLSDDLNAEQERQAIAHELGHIALHHLDADVPLPKNNEADADLFMIALLAPPPVLDVAEVDTPERIRRYTGLSLNDSRRAYQLLEDYRRDQQEAARREDIANRARLAMQPPAPVDIPALFSRPEVSVYIHQLLAATVPQLEKAVG